MARIISGSKTAEDLIRIHLERLSQEEQRPTVQKGKSATPPASSLDDFFLLRDISCKDVAGTVFEHYDELKVRKDIFRDQAGAQINLTPYNAAVHCEKAGLFLPSMALCCNLVARIFKLAVRLESNGSYTVLDPEAKKVLDMYKNNGTGFGWHVQNTIVSYKDQTVIHYPLDSNFPANSDRTGNINVHRSLVVLPFEKVQKTGVFRKDKVLQSIDLKDGPSDPLTTRFVRQYTGLEDPTVLVEIGDYFGKSSRIWFPSDIKDCNDTRAAWFGCYGTVLDLYADSNLSDDYAARGVRLGAP